MVVCGTDRRHVDVGLNNQEANWVLALCRRFLNRRDEVDDLYQTALVELHKAFRSAEGRGVIILHRGGFIYRVVINSLVYTYVQKTRKDLLYHSLNAYDALPVESHGDSVLEDIPEATDSLVLQDLILRILTPEESLLLRLHHFEGYSQTEIAEMTGLSQSSISIRFSRLKQKLRDAMEGEYGTS